MAPADPPPVDSPEDPVSVAVEDESKSTTPDAATAATTTNETPVVDAVISSNHDQGNTEDSSPPPSSMPESAPPTPPLQPKDHASSSKNDNAASEMVQSDPLEAKEEQDSNTTTNSSSSPKKNNKNNIQLPMKSIQSASERSKDFHELRSYEAKRRSIYASKLKSTSIYWRSYRKVLKDSYQETDRVENLIRGAFVANQAYAKFLQAAAEDRLDHNGRPVEGKRVSKMHMDRHKRGVSLQGGLTMKAALDAAGVEVKKKPQEQPNGTTNHQHEEKEKSDVNPSLDGLAENTMIHSLVKSHAAMADVFQENINFVNDVTLVKIVELRKELEAEVQVMTALGDTTLYELNRAETDVQKAWGKYYVCLWHILFVYVCENGLVLTSHFVNGLIFCVSWIQLHTMLLHH